MSLVYIAFGSNLGDSEGNVKEAMERLKKAGLILQKQSTLLKTAPYGVLDQPDFINAVCLFETSLAPQELLRVLNGIEQAMGRVRKVRWGARTIDLDIILYDDLIVNDENLQIPHKDMLNRDFVLRPLAQIVDEDFVHPVSGKSIKEHLADLC